MENFIVSARKYRPATFASVVGQSHITSTLKNAISRGQLAHAYLFCGPRGVGKTTCARIFAKAINCLHPTADAEACNECESCKAFNENRSFNIHELDAASNNSVDDIRNLIDQVRIPPQIGRYSVYIIDEVHMLSVQAFNAFLKTLEEPPAHAVFILATTEKHKIIPTILSRCQIYDFNRIRVEDGVEYLKYIASQEGVTYDDEALHIIAQKADGGMRDALSMFDKVVSFCGSNLTTKEVAETLNVLDYDTYFTVTQQILEGNYTDALLLFDSVLRKGFSGQTFVGGLNNHFRDLLMCKNPQTIPLLEVTGSVAERYRKQAEACSIPLLFEGINLLTSIDSGLRTATNQRLHVELGLMKLCGLGQKKNSDTLTPSLPSLQQHHAAQQTAPTAPAQTSSTSHSVPSQAASASPTASGAGATASSLHAQPAPPQPTMAPQPQPPSQPTTGSPTGPNLGQGTRTAISQPGSVSAPSYSAGPAPSQRPNGINGSATTPDTRQAAPQQNTPSGTTTLNASGSTGARPQRRTSGGLPDMGILSGRSISSILQTSAVTSETIEEPDQEETQAVEIDADVETALTEGMKRLTEEMMHERPRIGIFCQDAQVEGNLVRMVVPNESAYDELSNCLTALKSRLGELSDVHVPIQIQVDIKASTQGLKPIKVEDRLRYLTEKNPVLTRLRKELELDVE